MSETEICPSCDGKGSLDALVRRATDYGSSCQWESINCFVCHGNKVIDSTLAKRMREGRRMREDRLSRKETIKEAAERLGMGVVAYSQAERGID